MMQSYKTVLLEAQDEFTEKRSRFIGYCKPVLCEKEALAFIEEKRGKHWDAAHNVFAYRLRENRVQRCSDDGEPQGTAGVPMLEVLEKNQVTDTVLVVTRYFGGVLLGTGGLVRAYSHGAKLALEAGRITEMILSIRGKICIDYSQYGKISAMLAQFGAVTDDAVFTDTVEIFFHMEKQLCLLVQKQLSELTSGQTKIEVIGEEYLPKL